MAKVKKLNMTEEGLNRFFGPLEARIMDVLWSSGRLSIKEVQERLNRAAPISFNAVMTVMNRLREKGLLRKTTEERGRYRVSLYEPVQTKEQFLTEQTKALTFGLVREYGDIVLHHMIEALEDADPNLIAKLQEKLDRMKSGKTP